MPDDEDENDDDGPAGQGRESATQRMLSETNEEDTGKNSYA